MTPSELLQAVLPLVRDLSHELEGPQRYDRLLRAVEDLFRCDACALLRLEGDALVPLAVRGLSADTLGRRFRVHEHPRFAALMAHDGPRSFDADSPLPDPYDGLVDDARGRLAVHDCLGCALSVDGKPWGLLTLDALAAGRFAQVDKDALRLFASMAAATVAAAERLAQLSHSLSLERERAQDFRLAASTQPGGRRLIGRSAVMAALHQEIRTAGNSELTVLIRGETGTGKELVASALHAASPRATQPLVSINCAALPEHLVESELFGHVRGAFSGATQDRKGKFELADGGTLFLDEVGELPLAVQAKLLRVMQSGQLQRVGSDREHHVDVRIVAATNRDLADEVRHGRCRPDFYHRLSVYPLLVPPLRERGNDVLLIAGFFLEENRSRLGLTGLRLAPDAQAGLLGHAWPGNVRELEHVIARSALKALSGLARRPRLLTLTARDLGLAPDHGPTGTDDPAPPPGPAVQAPLPLRSALDAYERRLITQSLARHRHNWAAAARELGMDRANLRRAARRLGVSPALPG
ncbi:MAG TPA: nitric oxide reductase transcriptional regulator NorR [Pseudorhodoferax sp.]|nr:nitric oxide reductase transcriptional regulator NorR [Pseudorhodoferax sp.]